MIQSAATETHAAGKLPKFAVFLLLRATTQWLSLSRVERRAAAETHLGSALEKLPALSIRHFDTEAFSAECSDIMLVETSDLEQYHDFIEMLRDSPLVTAPYFEFVRIVPSIEDGFRSFEERTHAQAGTA